MRTRSAEIFCLHLSPSFFLWTAEYAAVAKQISKKVCHMDAPYLSPRDSTSEAIPVPEKKPSHLISKGLPTQHLWDRLKITEITVNSFLWPSLKILWLIISKY